MLLRVSLEETRRLLETRGIAVESLSASVDTRVWQLGLPPGASLPERSHPLFVVLLAGSLAGSGSGRAPAAGESPPAPRTRFHAAGTSAHCVAGSAGARLLAIEATGHWSARVEADHRLPTGTHDLTGVSETIQRLLLEIRDPDSYSALVIEGLLLELFAAACRTESADRQESVVNLRALDRADVGTPPRGQS